MFRMTPITVFAAAMLSACGGARYWRAAAAADSGAFVCGLATLDSLGYTLYARDDQRRAARAEIRGGQGFGYVSRDIIWLSVSATEGGGDSLIVTAGFADARRTGAGSQATATQPPTDQTRAHAAHVLLTCRRR